MTATGIDKRQSCYHDYCTIHSNILCGKVVQEIDDAECALFVCAREAYFSISKYICLGNVLQVGAASPSLFIGRKCYFVLKLRTSQGFLPQEIPSSAKDRMWFVVRKSSAPLVENVVRQQHNYDMHQDWFQKGGIIDFTDEQQPVVSHVDKILVSVITTSSTDALCDSSKDTNNIKSMMSNVLEHGATINISLNGIIDKKWFIHLLCSFYQSGDTNHECGTQAKSSVSSGDINTIPIDSYHHEELPSMGLTLYSGMQVVHSNLEENETKVKVESDFETIEHASDTLSSSGSNTHLAIGITQGQGTPRKFKVRDHSLLLDCPMCGLTFRSLKSPFKQLVHHIKRRHSARQKQLIKIVHDKYYCKGCSDCRQ